MPCYGKFCPDFYCGTIPTADVGVDIQCPKGAQRRNTFPTCFKKVCLAIEDHSNILLWWSSLIPFIALLRIV